MKKTSIAVLLSAALISTAWADDVAQVATTDAADAQAVFVMNEAQPMELASLSATEMKETEGAWVYYAASAGFGGVWGGLSYANSVPSYSRTYGGWAMAVGSGAVGGLVGNLGYRGMFYGGAIGFGGGWAATTYGRRR